jgi:SAM-dependent methyltransferase
METTELLVCPETLGPLEQREEGLWSPRAQRLYPVRDGLVFMAYAASDAEMIAETMEEERDWQGTAASVERDREFLTASAPIAVELINLATRLLAPTGPAKALELGSGSGWVSWLLAEAGYETWLCDFEANSLAIGRLYEHERMRDRVVTDARYCPFPDASFDLVLMKEFVHHVQDVETLFAEAQRVLRPGGLMVVMEPVRSVKSTVYELRHPDPHKGHHITWIDSYKRDIRRAGMELRYETADYDDFYYPPPRTTFIRRARQRAARETRGMAPLTPFAQVQLRIFGGASIVLVAEKTGSLPARLRPAMQVIDPATLQVSPEEVAAFSDFPEIIERVADGLVRIPSQDPTLR